MWQAEKFGIIKYDSSTDFLDITECEGASERERKSYFMGTSQSVPVLTVSSITWAGPVFGSPAELLFWVSPNMETIKV